MGQHIQRMKGWIDTFAEDVEVVRGLLDDASADKDARELAAGALNYLVTRMDIVPDWEETAGVLDDAMVLRVAVALASDQGLGNPSGQRLQDLARLANEAEVVASFLGPDLYPRLKKLVRDYASREVRGRNPETLVEDAKMRGHLYTEVEDELRRLPPAPMSDPDRVERTLKNYFVQKLQKV